MQIKGNMWKSQKNNRKSMQIIENQSNSKKNIENQRNSKEVEGTPSKGHILLPSLPSPPPRPKKTISLTPVFRKGAQIRPPSACPGQALDPLARDSFLISEIWARPNKVSNFTPI